jgi:N-acetyl-anhydromuramyl-L-alanine amidase AmpD
LHLGSDRMVISNYIRPDRTLQAQEHSTLKDVVAIVLHRTAGSDVAGALEGMSSRNLAVHFIVDKDGKIIQLASLNNWTSHLGPPKHTELPYRSFNTIGIEVVGRFRGNELGWEPLTQEQIISTAWLVKSLSRVYDINPAQVLNHEDLRAGKEAEEGNYIRRRIEHFIYRIDPDQQGRNNNQQTNTWPPRNTGVVRYFY